MGDHVIRVVVPDEDDGELTKEEVAPLAGFPIEVEGGVGNGKTALVTAIVAELEKCGVEAVSYPEPTDEAALANFMKYQKPPPEYASEDVASKLREAKEMLEKLTALEGAGEMVILLDRVLDRLPTADSTKRKAFEDGRRAAAVRMQTSMMQRRTAIVKRAAMDSKKGIVALVDRGAFGDTAFAITTYLKYAVGSNKWIEYIISFLSKYLAIDFPNKSFLIVRVAAPVSVTYQRYLARERDVGGNKYTPEYMQMIEDAHDSCARAWGSYVSYDNSDVPYHRPSSPGGMGYPDRKAVRAVIRALCALARERRAIAE
jgi:deoxyadenosine/deoxycytidine kinase